MRLSTRFLVAVSAVGALSLSGCGGDDTQGAQGGESSPTPAETTTKTPTGSSTEPPSETPSDTPTDDGALEVEVEIEDGTTTPAGKRIEVEPGQTVRLTVDSDTADELHLHAEPEQSFEVKPAEDQVFEFSIDTPGVYALESHETGNQVISIQVQP